MTQKPDFKPFSGGSHTALDICSVAAPVFASALLPASAFGLRSPSGFGFLPRGVSPTPFSHNPLQSSFHPRLASLELWEESSCQPRPVCFGLFGIGLGVLPKEGIEKAQDAKSSCALRIVYLCSFTPDFAVLF